MWICAECGFSCGTMSALQKHLDRTQHASLHDASLTSAAERCVHLGSGTCGCSKYQILGVPRAVSLDVLRATMKRLQLEWHPDRSRTAAWRAAHPGISVEQCTAEFQRLQEAFSQVELQVAARREGAQDCAPCSLPLIDAAKNGHCSLVRELLGDEPSAQLHSLDEGGMDALSWACRLGHQEIASVLLEAKQREAKHRADGHGGTANAATSRLIRASDASGSPSSTAALSSTALAIDAVPALWAAAASGDASIVSMVLSQAHGGGTVDMAAAVNEKESLLGHSSLHAAADRGHADVVRNLLSAAADVTATDRRGYSALSVASFKGHAPVVTLLLGANANIEHVAEGDPPLALACRRGRLEVAKLLLSRGARPDTRCVEQAQAKGHDAVVGLLSRHMAAAES